MEPPVNFTVSGPIPQNAPILTQAGPAIGLDRPQRESRVNMDDDDVDTAEPIARRGGRPLIRHPGNDGFQPHYADLAWPLVTDFLQRRV